MSWLGSPTGTLLAVQISISCTQIERSGTESAGGAVPHQEARGALKEVRFYTTPGAAVVEPH